MRLGIADPSAHVTETSRFCNSDGARFDHSPWIEGIRSTPTARSAHLKSLPAASSVGADDQSPSELIEFHSIPMPRGRFKAPFARILLFQTLIPQLHFGDFFNAIDPKRSFRLFA